MTNQCIRNPEPEIRVTLENLCEPLRESERFFIAGNVTPTTNEDHEEISNIFRNAWPSFVAFLILENFVLYLQKKATLRLNDSITSLSLGLMEESGRLLFRGCETAAYIYLHNNWKIVCLPWDSFLTWSFAFLSVDFCFYWTHRASHEVGLFWAQHQVHHSSEELNISTGLRQSVLQGWCSFIFYLPMAFFVPPTQFITHQQFNLLYQVYLHTDTIKTLGPLEYFLNTPQHHRVHHGCNLYCLDKNYGGIFIIWDRLFDTFAEEDEKEKIVYGLVSHRSSFNPLFLQIFYNKILADKFNSMKGFQNKLFSIIKGPSWVPGSPWTGFEKNKLRMRSRVKFDVQISFRQKFYVILHFSAILIGFHFMAFDFVSRSFFTGIVYVTYVVTSLTAIGIIFENHPRALLFETIRCCFVLVIFSIPIKEFEGKFPTFVLHTNTFLLFYLVVVLPVLSRFFNLTKVNAFSL